MRERSDQKVLEHFLGDREAEVVKKDVDSYMQTEKKKQEEYMNNLLQNKSKLTEQIADKKKPKILPASDFHMNKQLLLQAARI